MSPDYMAMATAERAELADLLVSLTPEQWDGPTLCDGWSVRDVVAHMFSYDELTPLGTVGRMVKGRLTPGGPNALGIAAYSDCSPGRLVTLVQENLRPRGLTAGFGGRIALCDGMIHQQDIRRPLGLTRHIPDDRMHATLEFAKTAPLIHSKKRIKGLALVATDVDWRTGDGPVVRGPAESLLMALAGRRGVTDELTGPGLPTLVERIG
ncbi:MAG: DinB family protein [Pseudonocardia sp. SCN 73-27]|uniref:maleylpyruvate isomerase family mycothiol-dependent enzyme n=1 Tax=unclassified Pseudonocardia TaxID=2619320 RepID=UPI00086AE81C|nr:MULTISPECIES: maleylpyruvate isomerase family mycothiol-dependent enzyme [unclassified Pseudonocardia]ODU25472.1 MAG: DinB family protein [Pseudonocardia sp. SCN 72-51]ODV05675.1 MAG: DinB family protein [Pseudonocardia sp. SCN 73-27]